MSRLWKIEHYPKLVKWLDSNTTSSHPHPALTSFCELFQANSQTRILKFIAIFSPNKSDFAASSSHSAVFADLAEALEDLDFPFYEALTNIAEESHLYHLGNDVFQIFSNNCNKASPQLVFLTAWQALNCKNLNACIMYSTQLGDKCAPALTLKGQALLESGCAEQAIKSLMRSVMLDAGEILAWFQLAKAQLCSDQLEEAWISMKQCSRLQPKNPEIALFFALIAIRSQQISQIEEAWTELSIYLTDFEDNDEVTFALIQLACLRTQKQQCLEIISQASWPQMPHHDSHFRKRLSQVLSALGEAKWHDVASRLLHHLTGTVELR